MRFLVDAQLPARLARLLIGSARSLSLLTITNASVSLRRGERLRASRSAWVGWRSGDVYGAAGSGLSVPCRRGVGCGTLVDVAQDPMTLIASDPSVLHGQATIAGTRVPVSVVLDCMAAGMSPEEIVEEYPSLTVAGVRAAAAYGARLAREELVPIAPR